MTVSRFRGKAGAVDLLCMPNGNLTIVKDCNCTKVDWVGMPVCIPCTVCAVQRSTHSTVTSVWPQVKIYSLVYSYSLLKDGSLCVGLCLSAFCNHLTIIHLLYSYSLLKDGSLCVGLCLSAFCNYLTIIHLESAAKSPVRPLQQ